MPQICHQLFLSPFQLSRIEPEVMAPVERYIIFYGLSMNSLQNISTPDNTTTRFTITDVRQGGNYSVGVAAMNSGGISIITYSRNIGMHCMYAVQLIIGWSTLYYCLEYGTCIEHTTMLRANNTCKYKAGESMPCCSRLIN